MKPEKDMELEQWIYDASDKIKKKMHFVVERNRDNIPYTTINGRYDDRSGEGICWWTNGFWGGMLWQLYNATKDELYKETAIKCETKLDANLMEPMGMDHDSGFKWLPTAVADYHVTGDRRSWKRGMLAADNLAGRFNPAGNYIRAWNEWNEPYDGSNAGIAIIDCMMNLPLLYWAYDQIKDPRYLHIAKAHAATVMKNFVREDGSVIHIGEFDPVTGEFIKSRGGQGYKEGSSWTRGQGWAVYGFTLSYIHTKDAEYLEEAEKIASYIISKIPESGLIPVDYDQPSDCTWEDSTASAVTSCGLIELYRITGKTLYMDTALKLLRTLYEKRCSWSEDTDNIVEKCTAAYHDAEHEFAIIYGDYYFIEAIWKLTGEELFIW